MVRGYAQSVPLQSPSLRRAHVSDSTSTAQTTCRLRHGRKKKSRLCNLKLSHTGYCAPLQHETRQRCSFTSTWSSAPLTVSQYVRQLGLCYQLGHPLPEEQAEVDPGPDGSSPFKQLQATTAKSCSNNLVSVFCLTLQSATTRLIKIVSNGRLELRCYGANC